ncbi:MAG: hypothetical protein DRI24_23860 [Deltaproteobacteria bacterium]|nr:MAG: hypothetical protein DRI24_23860 [Deltaproteobacteria bacterium]
MHIEGWDEFEERADSKVLPRVENRTIKQTLMRTRTALSKDIRKVYNVKAGDIGKIVNIWKMSWSPASYNLVYSGDRVQLRHFGLRPRTFHTARGIRKGVSVRIRKDRGRKVIEGGFYGPGGYPVYMRKTDGTMMKTKNKAAIEKRTGMSVAHMAGVDPMAKNAFEHMEHHLPLEFVKAMNFYVKD